MIAVFNSSPLIFLSKLSIIDQALKLFSEVNIPAYVRKEILHKEDIASDKLKALLRVRSKITPLLAAGLPYSSLSPGGRGLG